MEVYVITEPDLEYGMPIFIDVAATPEKALEIATEKQVQLYGNTVPLLLYSNNTQICESKDGKPWTTLYYVEKVKVK